MSSLLSGLLLTGVCSLILWIFLVFHHESIGNNDNGKIKLSPRLRTEPLVDTDTGFIKFKPVTPFFEVDPVILTSIKQDDDKKDLIVQPVEVDLSVLSGDTHKDRRGGVKGDLVCNGVKVASEIIYWKVIPGDNDYESPITPHHGVHHDR
jgi:hypothetical protein